MESPGVFSSPAVSQGGDVYAESQDGHLYSLHPDGSKAWTVEVFSAGLMNTLPHVAVGADGTIFTGWSHIDGARLQAFHPDGSSAWTFLAPCCGIPQASVGADGTAYFVAAPTVGLETIAVDSDGNKRWSVPTSGDVPDSIAIDAQGTTFFNRGGTLYAVDSLGVVRWSMVGPARTAIGRDRTLYGVDGGYLYAIGP
jgi:outer membrane protein assembly factor BamB